MGRRGKGIFWLGEWIEGAELEPPAPPKYWGYDRTDTVRNKPLVGSSEPLIRLWTTGGAVMVLTADDWRRAVADIGALLTGISEQK